MCGGCNVLAEGAGVSLIFARYWWVARQGRKVVAGAEQVAREAAQPAELPTEFIDPLPELLRVT